MTALKGPTIVDTLLALEGCTRFGARFVPRNGEPTFHPYDEVVRRAQWVAGTLQAHGLAPGDRVALILPTSIHFLDSFLGIQLAGGIPAAVYPPLRLGRLEEYYTRTRAMLTRIGARFLITDSAVRKLIGPAVAEVPSLAGVFDAADLLTPAPWRRVEIDPSAPAFLQFSSGTTLEPKAVVVTHTGLLHNLAAMDSLFDRYTAEDAEQGGVCWLPLYHDMGLVGCMFNGLHHPATMTYIGPELFIVRPAIWLKTMSRYKALISPAPDFAYGLCLTKIKDSEMEGVDLSQWIFALNGAEPIDTGQMERFVERFAQWGLRPEALTPVYGLAEAGLAVTFSDPWAKARVVEFDRDRLSEDGVAVPGAGRRLPSVGKPLPSIELEIRGPDGRPVGEGRVGRIMIGGPSITTGYYNAPEITAETIRDGWLDTGDLGFRHEGELYIAGRAKDLIILRGRNYAPQEIEELLVGMDGLRVGCAAAVGHFVEGAGEQLVILAEKDIRSDRPSEEMIGEIKSRLLTGLSLSPHHVEILTPGTLPRTSSGKLRRSDALRMFVSRGLEPPKKVGVIEIAKGLGRSQVAWAKFRRRRKGPA